MINLLRRSGGESVSFERIASVAKDLAGHRGINGQDFSGRCRSALLCVAALAAFFGIAGCSGTTAKLDSQTPLISVAINQAAPAALTVGSTAQVSATVSNDLATEGVDWVASCSSAPNCGSFSPAHTPSGGMTVYTAPLAVPAKHTVAVTALSSTDHSKGSSSNVTIISTVTAVNITQPPPASAPSGSVLTFAATVDGDPSNEGIDWKATCTTIDGSVDCTPGGFHSAPGAPSPSFVVPGPLQIPSIVGGTITITAFATADHSFSAFATFTVTDPLTITLTQVPPTTMLINSTATVAAVITNDTTNSGVNWSVSCANDPCGSVSPSHTATGVPATFTAPPRVPPPSPSNPNPNPVVTITATAAATGGPSVLTVTASVTIVVPISITLDQHVPNDTIVQNHNGRLLATVKGDPANAGVDWTVTCATAGNCGSFSPAHTASGAPTTFTAPATPGANVTITAAATADPTKTVTENVNVTAKLPPNALLLGQFVMLLTAKHSSNGPYAVGGVISGDGATDINGFGTITSATFDLSDASGNGLASVGLSASTPSTYSIGTDGRGQINLKLNTTLQGASFGVNGSGALTLRVVFVTPQHALITETDSFGDATGTLDQQNLQGISGFSGVFSLRLSGSEAAGSHPGYFVASAVNATSSSQYSYITDQSDNGMIKSASATVPSPFFNQPMNGSTGELSLSSVNIGLPTQFHLDLWAIDANHFVVTDYFDAAFGSPPVVVGGYFTAQPSSPAISGTYAFTEAGATAAGQSQVAGGIFTCGASTGTLDATPLGGMPTSNSAVNVACTAPSSGRGVITLSGTGSTGISTFAAYPTLDQGLALIELDGGTTGASGPSGAGVALQQTASNITAATFSGTYASNFWASTTLGSASFVANIVPNGVSAISGVADVSSFNSTLSPPGTPSFGASLTGSSFSAGTNGRFPLMLKLMQGAGQPTPVPATISPACYIVDANTCLLLGLDSTAPGMGIMLFQQTGL